MIDNFFYPQVSLPKCVDVIGAVHTRQIVEVSAPSI